MKRLIRRLARVADSTGYRPLRVDGKDESGDRRRRRRTVVPEGHVPVYVGEEMELFAVRADLLGLPAFSDLLARSAQEYGYGQRGVLRIPCSVPLFLAALRFGGDGDGDALSAAEAELADKIEIRLP